MFCPNRASRILGTLILLTLTVGLSACGKNQNVDLRFADYTVARANPLNGGKVMLTQSSEVRRQPGPPAFFMKLDGFLDRLFPKAEAAVSSIKMCFKRLRFKQENESTNSDSTQDEDNIDLTLGLVTLSTSGTDLSSVEIPKAVYKRIEFDLEDGCGVGYSLYLNNLGVYQTTDRMTIKFEGTFDSASSGGAINMSIQNIITALSSVTSGSQLKSAAEGASGSF